jgi:hypothetical protein
MVQLMMANEAVKRSTTALNEAVGMSATAENNIKVCEDMLAYDYLHDKRADKSVMHDRTTLRYYLDGAVGILDLSGMPSDRVIVQSDLVKGLLIPQNDDKVNFDTRYLVVGCTMFLRTMSW